MDINTNVVLGLVVGFLLLMVDKLLLSKQKSLDIPEVEALELNYQLLIIGVLSGFLGAVGHFFGRSLEHILSETAGAYAGRAANDFLRILAWNFAIGLLYLYAFHRTRLRADLSTHPGKFIAAVFRPALLCGAMFPLILHASFGTYSAHDQQNWNGSLLWFTCGGMFFGLTTVATWVRYLKGHDMIKPVLTGTVLCGLYGLFFGAFAFMFGGLGLNNAEKALSVKIAVVFFIGIMVPASLVYTALKGEKSATSPLFNLTLSLYIGLVCGVLTGNYFDENVLFKRFESSLIDQYGEPSIARLISTVYLLITNIPWGVCIALGILRSEQTTTHAPGPGAAS